MTNEDGTGMKKGTLGTYQSVLAFFVKHPYARVIIFENYKQLGEKSPFTKATLDLSGLKSADNNEAVVDYLNTIASSAKGKCITSPSRDGNLNSVCYSNLCW